MHRILMPRRHGQTPTAAILGVMASVALLVAWEFERRISGIDRDAPSMLLEFLMVFAVGFGTLVVAGTLTGLLWNRRRTRR